MPHAWLFCNSRLYFFYGISLLASLQRHRLFAASTVSNEMTCCAAMGTVRGQVFDGYRLWFEKCHRDLSGEVNLYNGQFIYIFWPELGEVV